MKVPTVVLTTMLILGASCRYEPTGTTRREPKEGPTTASDTMRALDAKLDFPVSVAIDDAGMIYVGERDGFRVRRIDPAKGEIATIAGLGVPGLGEDGIPASEALIGKPESLAVDSGGNLYIGERGTFRVRRIDRETGLISTYAGNGKRGFEGDGGPATEARISFPQALAFDKRNNLYIADMENQKIRLVSRSTAAIINVAGTGEGGFDEGNGVALDAKLDRPHAVAVAPSGDVVIGDSFNQRIRLLDPKTGSIRTIAGNGQMGGPVVGGKALDSPFLFFGSLAFDADGNLLVASLDSRILKIDMASGALTNVAGIGKEEFSGDGGPATEAGINLPYGMALDAEGNIVFADAKNGRVRRIVRATGIIETIAGGGSVPGRVVTPEMEGE
jgi:trimeric autotransporter adhesin